MTCPVCSHPMRHCFNATVLNKYQAVYEQCDACAYLRVRDPFWLEEAYGQAIAASDTGLVMRNVAMALKLSSVLFLLLKERGDGRYLDIAGGHGLLTRLMRDFGFDFYWSDPYCKNLLADGFDRSPDTGPYSAVTAIEVLEHVTNPLDFVEQSLAEAATDTFIFTTVLYEGEPPPPSWWYYAFQTGQHIGFFQRQTLVILGQKLGLSLLSANGVHILTRRPLSPTLYAMASHSLVSKVVPWWARHRLGSKTWPDHVRLLNRIG